MNIVATSSFAVVIIGTIDINSTTDNGNHPNPPCTSPEPTFRLSCNPRPSIQRPETDVVATPTLPYNNPKPTAPHPQSEFVTTPSLRACEAPKPNANSEAAAGCHRANCWHQRKPLCSSSQQRVLAWEGSSQLTLSARIYLSVYVHVLGFDVGARRARNPTLRSLYVHADLSSELSSAFGHQLCTTTKSTAHREESSRARSRSVATPLDQRPWRFGAICMPRAFLVILYHKMSLSDCQQTSST